MVGKLNLLVAPLALLFNRFSGRSRLYAFQPAVVGRDSPFFPEGAMAAIAIPVDPEGTFEWREDMDPDMKDAVRRAAREVKTEALRAACAGRGVEISDGLDPVILETMVPADLTAVACREREEIPRLMVWADGEGAVRARYAFRACGRLAFHDSAAVGSDILGSPCHVNLAMSRMELDTFLLRRIWNRELPVVENPGEIPRLAMESSRVLADALDARGLPWFDRIVLGDEKGWCAGTISIPKEYLGKLPFVQGDERVYSETLADVIKLKRTLPLVAAFSNGFPTYENFLKEIDGADEFVALRFSQGSNAEGRKLLGDVAGMLRSQGTDCWAETFPVVSLMVALQRLAPLEEPAPGPGIEVREALGLDGVRERDIGTICLPVVRVSLGIEAVFPTLSENGQVMVPMTGNGRPHGRGVENLLAYRVVRDVPEADFDPEKVVPELFDAFMAQEPRLNGFL